MDHGAEHTGTLCDQTPLLGALRVSEEPPRATFLAGVERLWPGPFSWRQQRAGEQEPADQDEQGHEPGNHSAEDAAGLECESEENHQNQRNHHRAPG